MLSLIKKLFAKKEESTAAPWPFPTGKVSVKPTAEPAPEVKVEAIAPETTVAKPAATKPKVAAKTAPRKPRKPRKPQAQ